MTRYAFYPFEFGVLKIGYTDDAVTFLKRVEQPDAENEPSALSDRAFSQIREYLRGERRAFDFPFALNGTPFQKRVWDALCKIPYGQTRSYKQIAREIGSPKACRAVGLANNKNPVTIAVPCHRVVGANGSLTGYAGGLAMKAALLALEQNAPAGESGQ
jgi:O-6-methylguanine DNA methyltransferase